MMRLEGTRTALPPAVHHLIPRLAAGLALLEDMQHLIIESGRHGRYVQFAAWDGCLRAESAGNAYLAPEDSVTPGQRDWLIGNGWHTPDDGGNFWREWTPTHPLEAATVTAITLEQVHDLDELDTLTFACENRAVLDAITGGAR